MLKCNSEYFVQLGHALLGVWGPNKLLSSFHHMLQRDFLPLIHGFQLVLKKMSANLFTGGKFSPPHKESSHKRSSSRGTHRGAQEKSSFTTCPQVLRTSSLGNALGVWLSVFPHLQGCWSSRDAVGTPSFHTRGGLMRHPGLRVQDKLHPGKKWGMVPGWIPDQLPTAVRVTPGGWRYSEHFCQAPVTISKQSSPHEAALLILTITACPLASWGTSPTKKHPFLQHHFLQHHFMPLVCLPISLSTTGEGHPLASFNTRASPWAGSPGHPSPGRLLPLRSLEGAPCPANESRGSSKATLCTHSSCQALNWLLVTAGML